MLKNYLRVAVRNLRRHAGYTALNVVGLGIGLACCLLIVRYVADEWSTDRFHENGERIYRVVTDFVVEGDVNEQPYTPALLAPTLDADVADIEATVRLMNTEVTLRDRASTRAFQESEAAYADPSIFDIFSLPFVAGAPGQALRAPGEVVLTESTARRYFGAEPAIGRVLRINNERDATVVGVMADLPDASHLDYDVLVSMATVEEGGEASLFANWLNTSMLTYVLAAPGGTQESIAAELPGVLQRHAGDRMQEAELTLALHLEPLFDMYLGSERGGMARSGNRTNLTLFGIVALFILVLAAINFVNLTTARATERSTEVGVRKALGAGRRQLVPQFLGESIGLALLAVVVALVLTEMLVPVVNAVSGKSLSLHAGERIVNTMILFGLALGVGTLAGLYPAFVLSRFRPASALRSEASPLGGGGVRRGLVVIQFVVSITLIACTLVTFAQLDYMRSEALGFDKEQVLVLDIGRDEAVQQRLGVIQEALAQDASVVGVAASNRVPGEGLPRGGWSVEAPDGSEGGGGYILSVDTSFPEVYQMELVAGRMFTPDRVQDSSAVLLNEAALAVLGIEDPADVIGQPASAWGREHEVVGVVRDYHFFSLHESIEPILMRVDPASARSLSLRLRSDDYAATLAALEARWATLAPDQPFEYAFLDETFDRQYLAEERFGQVFGGFAGLALLIACLGLLGLAAFTVERRRKEIGVRKVLGATVAGIVGLLTGDFARLVALAFLMAVPLAYIGMNRWLDGFAYRVELGAGVFLVAGGLALGVALLAVITQAVRAATADPIRALRSD